MTKTDIQRVHFKTYLNTYFYHTYIYKEWTFVRMCARNFSGKPLSSRHLPFSISIVRLIDVINGEFGTLFIWFVLLTFVSFFPPLLTLATTDDNCSREDHRRKFFRSLIAVVVVGKTEKHFEMIRSLARSVRTTTSLRKKSHTGVSLNYTER